ncbi:SAM-dependent methyltransferase [Actinomadura terrae]|uniref:SAM-dependent methyltransferase n=1 Tax=Actinomadura terrae TaxID=604353 RepID=UPI001FA7E193|nr:SAM-dependent methyltransferase [Actinomadura terrae]
MLTPGGIDTGVPSPARVYDCLLGGKDHYESDRRAAARLLEIVPSMRLSATQNRAFLGRAVQYLAGEVGIRQFLDIGTGLPTQDNVHDVAQRIAPSSRIVYVDNDAVVLAHARALLTSTPEGATDYLDADLRDPDAILEHASRTLDLDRPVALLLVAVLHFVPDADDPRGIVSALLDRLVPGSYLVISHGGSDADPRKAAEATGVYRRHAPDALLSLRTESEVARFFDGLDLVEPGLGSIAHWRPAGPIPSAEQVGMHGGVARKP